MSNENASVSILKDKIQINLIALSIWKNKKKFILPLCIAFFISSFFMLSIPRYYKVKVMMAPEYNVSTSSSVGLKSLSSMMGINMGSSSDAIVPMFYPDLMKSTDFIVPLMSTRVKTLDGDYEGTLFDYRTKHCKSPWWSKAIEGMMSVFKKKQLGAKSAAELNPFRMTRPEAELIKGVSNDITCSVDKKTDVITLSVTAQDPLVAAMLADTVMDHLKVFITDYRTKKAKIDLQHYTQLRDEAREAYKKAQREYASFVDTHFDISLQSYKTEEERLENEMQMAHSTYSELVQRVQYAHSKVEERTPVFTVLQNSSVPTRHEGPKRMITVLFVLFMTFIGTGIWVISKDKSLKY